MEEGLPPPPFGHYLSCFILHFNREIKGSPVDAVFSSVNYIYFPTKVWEVVWCPERTTHIARIIDCLS